MVGPELARRPGRRTRTRRPRARRRRRKPIENVASPRWPSSASSATIRLESSPPESSMPDRHVGDHPPPHRDAQRLAHRARAQSSAAQSRVRRRARTAGPSSAARARAPSGSTTSSVAGGELAHAAQDRARRGHDRVPATGSGAARPGRSPCPRRRPASSAGSVEAKRSAPSRLRQVQRLDAQPVARRAPRAPLRRSTRHEREHARAGGRRSASPHCGASPSAAPRCRGREERVAARARARRAARGGCRCSR